MGNSTNKSGLQSTGQIPSVGQSLRDVIKIHQSQSPESIILANAYSELGEVYFVNNYFDNALEEFLKCLVILERKESDELLIAKVHYNIGKVYFSQGLFAHSFKEHSKSLELRLALCPNSVDTARSYNALGNIYELRLDKENADEHFTLALDIETDLFQRATNESFSVLELVNDKSGIAQYLTELGDELSAEGLHIEALSKYNKALQIHQRIDFKSISTADTYTRLGHTLSASGSYVDAVDKLEMALKLYREIDATSQVVAEILMAIGHAHVQIGTNDNYEEALISYRQAESIFAHLDTDSVQFADACQAIGNCLIHQNISNLPEAIIFFQRHLAIYEQNKPGSLIVADAHNNLGKLLTTLSTLPEQIDGSNKSLLHHQVAKEIYERLVPDTCIVADTYVLIGLVYKEQGYYSTAVVEFHKALDLHKALLGADSQQVMLDQEYIDIVTRKPKTTESYL